ncbi:hypothetical protein [Sphaerothrix gracilis]|uniref:hypothetical protein n=1 Tax=Sphaerothrix gracilis TaxID=3151835 RepID=UPI0031FD87A1
MVQWKTLFYKTSIWLVAECLLGILGLDHLCDYSEFLEHTKHISHHLQPANQSSLVVVAWN